MSYGRMRKYNAEMQFIIVGSAENELRFPHRPTYKRASMYTCRAQLHSGTERGMCQPSSIPQCVSSRAEEVALRTCVRVCLHTNCRIADIQHVEPNTFPICHRTVTSTAVTRPEWRIGGTQWVWVVRHCEADPVARQDLSKCMVVRSRPTRLVGSEKNGRRPMELGASSPNHLENCGRVVGKVGHRSRHLVGGTC
jgi:hypothetical protein